MLILLATGGQSAPQQEGGLDRVVVREVLCGQETGSCGPKNRRCPNRAWAFDQQDWSSVGICQIHFSTAYEYGYSKTKNPKDLYDEGPNREVADWLLWERIEPYLIQRGARVNVYNLAFKYRCGINRKIERRTDPEKNKTPKGQRCAEYAERAVVAYNAKVKK